MTERFLYSNVSPLLVEKSQKIINDCFREEIKRSDQLEISVGFCSYNSLRELDRLVTQQNIKNVCLILGMYYFIGFPESLHKLALEINAKWQVSGIGEIRLTHSLRYHGKLYCFLKDNQIFSAILGSPNLSFLLADEESQSKQYEIALITKNTVTLKNSLKHIQNLKSINISENIAILEKYKSVPDEKPSLVKATKVFKITYKKFS